MPAEAFGAAVLAVARATSCGVVAGCVLLDLAGVVVVVVVVLVVVVLGEEMLSGTSIVSSMLSMEFEVSRAWSRPSKPVLELFFLCFFLEDGMVGRGSSVGSVV